MLEWLAAHGDLLNLVANWAMVAIWIAYLQVFLRSFRRQTRPKIVINRAAGSSLGAACFVSNMGSEAIYIESVIVRLQTASEVIASKVTDFTLDDDPSDDPKLQTYQGVLGSSQYSSLGRFDDLITMVARRKGYDPERLKSAGDAISVEITIIADYATEDLLIGATRRFRAQWRDDHWALTAETPETKQIRSRSQRKRLAEMLASVE